MLVLDSEIVMESLDVHSRFTNIRLKETFNIYANTLFENTEGVEGLSKIQLRKFCLLLQKSSILFLMENSASNTIESLWVLRFVVYCLML